MYPLRAAFGLFGSRFFFRFGAAFLAFGFGFAFAFDFDLAFAPAAFGAVTFTFTFSVPSCDDDVARGAGTEEEGAGVSRGL